MFDYFEKGHLQGYADAQAGKSKNLEHGMPLLSALISDHAVSSYCNGYNAGFDKGKREALRKRENRKSINDSLNLDR